MEPNAERIKEIFGRALEKKSLAEREAWLTEACSGDPELRRQVDSLLLAHERAGGFLSQTAPPLTAPIAPERPGSIIGRYKLLEHIGEGGFGTVWMAEQEEPVRRRVALKVIKPGMDTKQVLARFDAERQALAMMDHPSIARVFDGGATDAGRPFFVMELVRGTRITDYCDANKLPFRGRLELFIQVCQAVQHAHQKGIIHRDLKPSNILITEVNGAPVPKVIDFGVAKATQARLTELTLFTGLHQIIGTPSYMSPEQAGLGSLDVDTRSDIYMLGVLLYELLTDQTPLTREEFEKAGLDEIFRLIRERDPEKPSTRLSSLTNEQITAIAARRGAEPLRLNRLLTGDLDCIVMKALEKDRRRRYETASGLASDLVRHLNNEPVIARPPSNIYRFQKAWRRNKAAFAVAALIAFVLMMATGISAWQAVRATRAETLAKKRLAETEALLTTLSQVAGAMTMGNGQISATDKTFLRNAIELQVKMLEFNRRAHGNGSPETLKMIEMLADFYQSAGRRADAIKLWEEALAITRKIKGEENADTLNKIERLAQFYRELGGHGDAVIRLWGEAVALSRKVRGSEKPGTRIAMEQLATAHGEAGQAETAIKLREEILALSVKVRGPEHPYTISAMQHLAEMYGSVRRDNEALAMLEKTAELDPKGAGVMLKLAIWQAWLGRDAEYEATRQRLFQQADELDLAAQTKTVADAAEQIAKACCLRPTTDAAWLKKQVELGKRSVEIVKGTPWQEWGQLAFGMAQYRDGQYAAAERTLAAVERTGTCKRRDVMGTARLYRAMSTFQQDRVDEARKLFKLAGAQMPPLPPPAPRPIVDKLPVQQHVLICWLACKEAMALLGEKEPAGNSSSEMDANQLTAQKESAASGEQSDEAGSSSNDPWKGPGGASTREAANFVKELLIARKLPDTEDGKQELAIWTGNSENFRTNYPIVRTFRQPLKSGPFVNHYKVAKYSADGSWNLERAWRTDSSNHEKTVKVYYPVPAATNGVAPGNPTQ